MGTGRRHGRGLEEEERKGMMQLYCNFLIAKKEAFSPEQTDEGKVYITPIFATLQCRQHIHYFFQGKAEP